MITVGKRGNNNRWEHNHIEDGINYGYVPISNTKYQEKIGKNVKGKKSYGLLINHKVSNCIEI